MIVLTVHGTPVPQGSKSAFVRGGRAVVVDGTSKKGRESHTAWRQAVASAARDYQDEHNVATLDGAVHVVIGFSFDRPPSVSVKKRPLPSVKPDIDKLVRSVLDAITGILIRDDAQVVRLSASKMYASPPGCYITISEVSV